MNYKELKGYSIREGFELFNKENPHIFEIYETQIFKAIKNGAKKVSSKLIINWIRWNAFVESSDKNFRINDAYQSYYARHFVEKHPEYFDLFDFRKLRNEESGRYMIVDEKNKYTFI